MGEGNNKTLILGTEKGYQNSASIKSLKGGQDCSSGISINIDSSNTSKVYCKVDGGSLIC